LKKQVRIGLPHLGADAKLYVTVVSQPFRQDEREAWEWARVNLDVEAVRNASIYLGECMKKLASSLEQGQPLTKKDWKTVKDISEAYQTEIACSLESIAKWTGNSTVHSSMRKVYAVPITAESEPFIWRRKSPITLREQFKNLTQAWNDRNRKVSKAKLMIDGLNSMLTSNTERYRLQTTKGQQWSQT
jgi:hypothetical protein